MRDSAGGSGENLQSVHVRAGRFFPKAWGAFLAQVAVCMAVLLLAAVLGVGAGFAVSARAKAAHTAAAGAQPAQDAAVQKESAPPGPEPEAAAQAQNPPDAPQKTAGTAAPRAWRYTWAVAPQFACDRAYRLDVAEGATGAGLYVVAEAGGRWAIANADDGKLLLEGIPCGSEDAYVCQNGGLHGIPGGWPEGMDEAGWAAHWNVALRDAGLPFHVESAHGSYEGTFCFYRRLHSGDTELLYVFASGETESAKESDAAALAESGAVVGYFEGPKHHPNLKDYTAAGGKFAIAAPDGAVFTGMEFDTLPRQSGGVAGALRGGKVAYYAVEARSPVENDSHGHLWDVWGHTRRFGGEEVAVYGGFYNGLCPVAQDGKYGYLAESGALAVPLELDGALDVYGGRAWAKSGGLWGVLQFEEVE